MLLKQQDVKNMQIIVCLYLQNKYNMYIINLIKYIINFYKLNY